VLAHLIERGALNREDAPVGIGRRVRAAQNVKSLLEVSIISQRAAISGKQHLVAGIGNRRLFHDCDSLLTLAVLAQGLSVLECGSGIAWIGAVALAKSLIASGGA
jgi:hypothetical protein